MPSTHCQIRAGMGRVPLECCPEDWRPRQGSELKGGVKDHREGRQG